MKLESKKEERGQLQGSTNLVFTCTQNSSARTFVHAKFRVHKAVIVGAYLHRLIYNVLIDIVFPYIFCHQLTL